MPDAAWNDGRGYTSSALQSMREANEFGHGAGSSHLLDPGMLTLSAAVTFCECGSGGELRAGTDVTPHTSPQVGGAAEAACSAGTCTPFRG